MWNLAAIKTKIFTETRQKVISDRMTILWSPCSGAATAQVCNLVSQWGPGEHKACTYSKFHTDFFLNNVSSNYRSKLHSLNLAWGRVFQSDSIQCDGEAENFKFYQNLI